MTTSEQRLRELVRKFTECADEWEIQELYAHANVAKWAATELAAILAEPVEVSEDMLDRAHDAYESEARHTANNIALRNAITAALKEPGQ